MSELRDRLERLGERVPSAPDGFERLERARRRRERNRRITAAAVALLVAIAGSVAALAAFTGSEPRAAGDPDDGFVAIWPESTHEEALAVQELVDAGDPSLAWRLDARETALAFARDALGWSDISVEVGLDDRRTEVLVTSPGGPCGPLESACQDPRQAEVVLVRLDGASNGIWSVVSARSPEFEGPPAVGSEIDAGERIDLATRGSAASANLYVAFVGTGSCAGWEHDTVATGPRLSVAAPRLPPTDAEVCPLALVVLHNDPADQATSGLGRQLLEYGYRTTLHALLAVPLRLVPGTSDTVPDVANVTCDGSSITADTSVVAAQPDGVHINYSTVGDAQIVFIVEDDFFGAGAGSASSVSSPRRGTTDPNAQVILRSGPGRYLLSCDGSPEDGSTNPARFVASLDVVDPDGYFVPAEPGCAGGEAFGMAPAYAPGAIGDRGDPVEVVRARLTGLLDGDIVERAGYPQGHPPLVRVVRDGAVFAKVALFDDGQGGWLLSSLEACGTGGEVGWSTDASGGGASESVGSADSECTPATDFTVTIETSDLAWPLGCVTAPAGERLFITLINNDASGHSISLYPEGSDEPVFEGEICLGPDRLTYRVPPLEPGSYRLVDGVDPTATGLSLAVV